MSLRAFMLLGLLATGLPAQAQQSAPDTLMTRALPPVGHADDILQEGRVELGVYDPHGIFNTDRAVDIEHIFIYWQALDYDAFRQALKYVQERGRKLMITVEPYTRAENWRDGGDHLFEDILAGRFDAEIQRICAEFKGFQGDVLIRWGHEMEDPTGRYPWARRDNKGYKAAFRHVVARCRAVAPKAAFVWSPKGEPNLADYYPGDDVVDFVGLSLWGLQAYDKRYEGRPRSFAETFREKYARVAAFAKPVIISELGVSGDPAYRSRWFESLMREIAGTPTFAQLRAVVYFNDKEPWVWPDNLGSPDWRISSGWFSRAKEFAQQR